MYKLTQTDAILRLRDNAFIFPAPDSAAYQEYLEWIKSGNNPLPADTPSLDDARAAKKAEIRSYREKLLLLTPFNGKVFQTDVASKIQVMAIAGQASLPPSAAEWRTADNSYASMTLVLFQQLMAAIMQREGDAFTNSSRHQDAVDALADLAAINTYDFSSGWPA